MKRNFGIASLAAFALLWAGLAPSLAAETGGSHKVVEKQPWSFAGIFGTYDKAQLRRGYQVYREVCAACHSMKLMYYRNLAQPGGPEYTEEEVKALIADVEVPAGPDDEGNTRNEDGELLTRPAKLFDRFVSPYENDNQARAANNGALPPDLSVIVKARAVHRTNPWYLDPVNWISDIFSNYQESGADYVYALLTGYEDEPPEGFKLLEGMSFNHVFPGNQIGMPPPLSEGAVEYTDGTEPTLENLAADVTAFLAWAAEPHLAKRKQTGLAVMIYLVILTVLMYLVKRAIWSRVKH